MIERELLSLSRPPEFLIGDARVQGESLYFALRPALIYNSDDEKAIDIVLKIQYAHFLFATSFIKLRV